MDIEKKLMPDEKIFIRSEVTKKPFVIKMIELGITELLLLGVLFLVLVNIGSVNDDNIASFIVLLSVFGDLFCLVSVFIIIETIRMTIRRYDLIVTNMRVIAVHKDSMISMPYEDISAIAELRKGYDKRCGCGRIYITTKGKTYKFRYIKSSEKIAEPMMKYHEQYKTDKEKIMRQQFVQSVPEQIPVNNAFRFCSKCGEKNDLDDVFCKVCGAKIK